MDQFTDISEWEAQVPDTISADTLWRMRVYRLSLYASDLGWGDVVILAGDARARGIADQLYRALGSIGANVAEGYSRSTGKDRARFYAIALGSARESRDWYYKGRFRLGEEEAKRRMEVLSEIIRLLLAMVEGQSGHSLREPSIEYGTADEGIDRTPRPPLGNTQYAIRDTPTAQHCH